MAEDTNPIGNLFSAGLSFATGNPLGAAAGIAGLGLQIFGGIQKAEASSQIYKAQQEIAGLETKQDSVRRQAMELSARRQQMEALRNQQRARSLALQNATTQGASQGSGLQGGYGQISGQTNWNLGGIQSNLEFGNQMFDLNALIGKQKQNISRFGGDASTAGGIASIGSALSGSVTGLGKIQGGSTRGDSGSIPTLDSWGASASRIGQIV